MRVLNVQIKHIHGGEPRAFLGYTQMLTHAGNEVFVLINPGEPYLDELKKTGAQIIKSKKYGELNLWDITTITYFRKLIKEINPDVIITHNSKFARIIRLFNKIPVIDVNHGRSARQSRFADASIVSNKQQYQEALDCLGSAHPIYKLHNSIDLSSSPSPQLPRQFNHPPVIGTISRLVNEKALDVFVDAAYILYKKSMKFKIIMAGEGEERALLESKISTYGMENIISMPGWADNPDEFYKSIDIFCLPSRREAFGLVILEAWKHGLPVIVSDADGPADIATHGVDALVIPKENPQSLADALQYILQNKEFADSIAAGGYKTVKEKFSKEFIAKQLQGVIEEVYTNRKKL